MSIYVYEALPDQSFVRVLVLYPASSRADPLECDLVLYDRDAVSSATWPDASYDAVSYVWGEPNFTHQIMSRSTSTKLAITQNVDTILRYLRKTESPCRLWLDAVCINQVDEDEKSIQVSIMGQIYRRARKTHVWLGEGDDDTATVFSRLHAFAGLAPQDGSSSRRRSIPPGLSEGLRDFTTQKLVNFLCHPWFRRRWVIQEVALSHDVRVHVGDKKISWTLLKDGLDQIIQHNDTTIPDNEARLALTTIKHMHISNGNLLDLIWHLDYTQCSDPRDRFYALLATLSKQYPGIPLPVEYRQHWTGLFLRVANSESLDNLIWHRTAFGALSDIDASLPSWVPNWSRPRKYLGHDNRWYTIVHGQLPDANSLKNSQDGRISYVREGWQPEPRGRVLELRGRPKTSGCVVWGTWPTNASIPCLSEYLDQELKGLYRSLPANDHNTVKAKVEAEAKSGLRNLIVDILFYCNVSQYHDHSTKNQPVVRKAIWKKFTEFVFLWLLGLLTTQELEEKILTGWMNMIEDQRKLHNRIVACLSHWPESKRTLEGFFKCLGSNGLEADQHDFEVVKYVVGNSVPLLLRHLENFMTQTTLFYDNLGLMWLGAAGMQTGDSVIHGLLDYGLILRPTRSVDYRAMNPRSPIDISDGTDTVYRLIGVCRELSSKQRGKTLESTSNVAEPARNYSVV